MGCAHTLPAVSLSCNSPQPASLLVMTKRFHSSENAVLNLLIELLTRNFRYGCAGNGPSEQPRPAIEFRKQKRLAHAAGTDIVRLLG